MARRCFPVAEIVGSSPIGVVESFLLSNSFYLSFFFAKFSRCMIRGTGAVKTSFGAVVDYDKVRVLD